ncbi:hypothetical protein WDW89_20700 [Deltaproteobacteria bacterium TL4]
MPNGFDPKEKNAILIFIAVLLLIFTYFYTHEVSWKQKTQIQSEQENIELKEEPSGRYY